MPPFRQPSFQESIALAKQAKMAALEKYRAKPIIDEAVLAQRREAEANKAAERMKVAQEKREQREAEKSAKKERAAQNTAIVSAAPAVKTPEELKLERDAKYAARKQRLGRR